MVKFSVRERTYESIVHAKFYKNRSRDTPLFIKKIQILTTFSYLSPHFYTYNVEIWLKGANLGIPQRDKIS